MSTSIQQVKFLEKILRLMPGNVYWKDTMLKYQGCNNNVAKILGLTSPDDIIGKQNKELFNPQVAELNDTVDQHVITGDKPHTAEEPGFDVHGQPAIYLTTKTPVHDDDADEIIGLLGISIDITKQKETEKKLIQAKEAAEAANKAKDTFLAMISHELRTPLNGILGMVNILKEGELTTKQLEIANDIQSSADTLFGLVSDLLTLSKFEAQGILLSRDVFDIKHVLHHLVRNLSVTSTNKAIDFVFDFDNNIEAWVVSDKLRLSQVITNLISNATKFTKQGHIKLIARLISKEDRVQTVYLGVEDTGIGISTEQQEKIFKSFTQLDDDKYNRHYGGLGLGLSISKLLVKAFGGDLNVKSEVGQGSTFYFEMPIPIANETDVAQLAEKDKAQYDLTDLKLNVLVIEDNKINQKVVSHLLKSCGCGVDIAADGETGINLCKENQYHLAFVDIGLPDMPGTEVIKALRTFYKEPVIALTAHALESQKQEFLSLGADDVLTKPLQRPALEKILKQIK